MSWGPFSSELGGKPIMDHISKKLFPVIEKLKKLSLDIGNYKQGFVNSFFRVKLSKLEKQYRLLNKEFLEVYYIYQTPDELFKSIEVDEEKKISIIADYFKSQQSVTPHLNEGFHLLEVMNRTLTGYSQSADQRVSTFLAILAITISIVVAISS